MYIHTFELFFSIMNRYCSELNFTFKQLHEQAAFETKYCRVCISRNPIASFHHELSF